MVQARHDAGPHQVPAIDKDDGNGPRRRLRRKCRGIGIGHDHVDPAADQIGRQRGQAIVALLRPAVVDRHVAALDVTGLAQALLECSDSLREGARGYRAQEAEHRRCLLRARRERPRDGRAAERADELAPPHGTA